MLMRFSYALCVFFCLSCTSVYHNFHFDHKRDRFHVSFAS
jgi:hypothetical protein